MRPTDNLPKLTPVEIQSAFLAGEARAWDEYEKLPNKSVINGYAILFGLAQTLKWQHLLKPYLLKWGAVEKKYVDDKKATVPSAAPAATALLATAASDHKQDVKSQSKAKAFDINYKNSDGYTALHYARADAVAILIRYGANVNVRNSRGQTPLMLIIGKGIISALKIAKVLLEHGADLSLKDGNGFSALEYLLGFLRNRPLKDGSIEKESFLAIIELFFKYGVDVHANNLKGISDVTICDRLNTAMLLTTMREGEAQLNMLVRERGGRPLFDNGSIMADLVTHQGETVLSRAASNVLFMQTVARLLGFTFSTNSLNSINQDQFRLDSCLYIAVVNVYPNSIKALLALGANIQAVIGAQKNTILMVAATHDSLQMVLPLLGNVNSGDHKAAPSRLNLEARNKGGQTALLLAATYCPSNVPALLELGAKVNVVDHKGNTPIYTAARCADVFLIDQFSRDKFDAKTVAHVPEGETLSLVQQIWKNFKSYDSSWVTKKITNLVAVGAVFPEEFLHERLMPMILFVAGTVTNVSNPFRSNVLLEFASHQLSAAQPALDSNFSYKPRARQGLLSNRLAYMFATIPEFERVDQKVKDTALKSTLQNSAVVDLLKMITMIFEQHAFGVLFRSQDNCLLPIQYFLNMSLPFNLEVRRHLLENILSVAPYTQWTSLDEKTKAVALTHTEVSPIAKKYRERADIIDLALHINACCKGKHNNDLKIKVEIFVALARMTVADKADSKGHESSAEEKLEKIITEGIKKVKPLFGTDPCMTILAGLKTSLSEEGKLVFLKFKRQWRRFDKFKTLYPEHFADLTAYLRKNAEFSSFTVLMQKANSPVFRDAKAPTATAAAGAASAAATKQEPKPQQPSVGI